MKRTLIAAIFLALFVLAAPLTARDYEYVITVCQDPNDPGCPGADYTTINDAIEEMNQKDPPLDWDTLGCIEVYDGTYEEHLNDHYEDEGCNNLPAHCDLIGKGDEIDDVVIKHYQLPGYGAQNGTAGVKANGDNVISHLKIWNPGGQGVQLNLELADDSEVTNCNLWGYHGGIFSGISASNNIVVSGCDIYTWFGACISVGSNFSISNCNLEPDSRSYRAEGPTGVIAWGSGTVTDVNIVGALEASGGCSFIGVRVNSENPSDIVTVSDTIISLQFTSLYKEGVGGVPKVCGILSGDIGPGNYPLPGRTIVRDCTIDITGVEDDSDPNGDGAGIEVNGIQIHSWGVIEVYGNTSISTCRTKASNHEDGYEYLLNNENGTLYVDFDTVAFDPNCDAEPDSYDPNYVNGTITDYRVENINENTEYFFIQDAIDDANDSNVIEALPCVFFETVDFNGKAITLRNTDPNDWDVVAQTIIDADTVTGNAVKIDANSVLTGFTITNGNIGVYCRDSAAPIISNCIIEGNTGGVSCATTSSPQVVNNVIRDSTIGIVVTAPSSPTVTNNFIYSNSYGMFTATTGSVSVRNNTIVGNSTSGIYKSSGTAPTISNCILWGNVDDLYGCSATYSCIEDPNDAGGTGNITSNPLFIDPNNDDYHIKATSPCVDAGNSSGIDPNETDIDGEPRRMDLDGQASPSSIVDMGADEVAGRVYNITQDKWYTFIQDAIDDANDADTLEANQDTYTENVNFKGRSITLRSTDPNDWAVVAETIIDASGGSYAVLFESSEDANSVITGFTVTNSSAGSNAGGIYCNGGSPTITKCIIEDNSHGVYCADGFPTIENNMIQGNRWSGIASGSSAPPTIKNNWIYHNDSYGVFCASASSAGTISNNTIADNPGKGIYVSSGTAPIISNCILWDNVDDLSGCSATYSCIEDPNDAAGTGNITDNPLFVDPNSYDYHLKSSSPCINAGDPNGDYTGQTDIDGESRLQGAVVDMGADETSYRVHNITQDTWYVNINDAIDDANNSETLEAYQSTYNETVNFDGKAVIVRSTDPNDWDVVAATIIDANNPTSGKAVKFNSGENANSVLEGFTVRNGKYGIYCYRTPGTSPPSPVIRKCIIEDDTTYGVYCWKASPRIFNNKIRNNGTYGVWAKATSPPYAAPVVKNNWIYGQNYGIYSSTKIASCTVSNNTIVDNSVSGIHKSSYKAPTITNCILWDNGDDLYNCTATYSCIEDPNDAAGMGNISSDPNFVDPNSYNYHLQSNSPCIDVGDPNGVYTGEYDIDGDDRVIDIAGKGDGTVDVDMGGDEYKEPD